MTDRLDESCSAWARLGDARLRRFAAGDWPLAWSSQGSCASGRCAQAVGAQECAERRWGELSDWQRVLVGLACGIVSQPRLLVIDDLFDGLGISKMHAAGELLSSLARELGCGVLMSASGMEVALMADAVWLFGSGGLQLMSDQTAGPGEVVEFPEVGSRVARRGLLGVLEVRESCQALSDR